MPIARTTNRGCTRASDKGDKSSTELKEGGLQGIRPGPGDFIFASSRHYRLAAIDMNTPERWPLQLYRLLSFITGERWDLGTYGG